MAQNLGARQTGQHEKNPQRFAGRSDPATGPLGAPPSYLSENEVRAWHSFADEWPWLAKADRAALVPLCKLRVKVEDKNEVMPVSLVNEYRLQLSSFGGTPTTRSKVTSGIGQDAEDPADEFLN
ncbi:hypothetical protein [Boseongicola aestuarii]|uniref:Phage terminase, small subunit n=1 Tax=Boseongicola aestuarii TaxID=1470561 RepID=A0A238J641_9RHOB|nr:hypothetical protein [Boseongicola aestuarii]SMX25811.1 hypothetical protein BOA8489_03956 [Boseongicola aestuarii]